MTQRFDLVVIGTGTAASGVASRCRNAGWSVAIVDERPFGGTCALRGCDPKKVLRRAAEVVDALRDLKPEDAIPAIDYATTLKQAWPREAMRAAAREASRS